MTQGKVEIVIVASVVVATTALAMLSAHGCSPVKSPTRDQLNGAAESFCQARALFKLIEPPFDMTAHPKRAALEIAEDKFCAEHARAALVDAGAAGAQ